MKKIIVKILCTTGISLILLAIVATAFGAKFLMISSVFETFAANILIHVGLMLLSKVESKYTILKSILDIGYMIIVLMIFGMVFNWFTSTPICVLVIMAILLYLISLFLSLFRTREDVRVINELLQKRNDSNQNQTFRRKNAGNNYDSNEHYKGLW